MSLMGHLFPPLDFSSIKPSTIFTKTCSFCHQISESAPQNLNRTPFLLSNLLSLALTVTLNSPVPSLAIPSSISSLSQSPLLPPTTPFSQSKNLQLGLENGKIRPCPSINPGCVSTNPKSSSFAFPWRIPENSKENAIQKLQEAILKTQKNVKINVIEDTPYGNLTEFLNLKTLKHLHTLISPLKTTEKCKQSPGQYLQAEVDGGFGRDVVEFLVKEDVVAYRCMATKVTYVYPFTTALGDSKGQEERTKKIINELGWYAPSFDTMN